MGWQRENERNAIGSEVDEWRATAAALYQDQSQQQETISACH